MSFLISGSSITMTFWATLKIKDLNEQAAFSHRVNAACLLTLLYCFVTYSERGKTIPLIPSHEYDKRRLGLTYVQRTPKTIYFQPNTRPADSRITSSGFRTIFCGSFRSSFNSSINRSTARCPRSSIGWATVVSGGLVTEARIVLSNPIMDTSSGTRRPSSLAA